MSPNELFEFVVEGHTTWRCEVAEAPDGTLVTESPATRRTSGGRWIDGSARQPATLDDRRDGAQARPHQAATEPDVG